MRAALLALSAASVLAACAQEPQEPDPETPARPVLPANVAYEADPDPYDESLDANAALNAAFARAQENGTRVLVKFGGDWCPDCRILAGMFDIPQFAAFLDDHYEVVSIDIGRYDRNEDVFNRFNFEEFRGAPTVVVATADGRILNRSSAREWTTARERDPQEALDYFYDLAFAEVPQDADQVEGI